MLTLIKLALIVRWQLALQMLTTKHQDIEMF